MTEKKCGVKEIQKQYSYSIEITRTKCYNKSQNLFRVLFLTFIATRRKKMVNPFEHLKEIEQPSTFTRMTCLAEKIFTLYGDSSIRYLDPALREGKKYLKVKNWRDTVSFRDNLELYFKKVSSLEQVHILNVLLGTGFNNDVHSCFPYSFILGETWNGEYDTKLWMESLSHIEPQVRGKLYESLAARLLELRHETNFSTHLDLILWALKYFVPESSEDFDKIVLIFKDLRKNRNSDQYEEIVQAARDRVIDLSKLMTEADLVDWWKINSPRFRYHTPKEEKDLALVLLDEFEGLGLEFLQTLTDSCVSEWAFKRFLSRVPSWHASYANLEDMLSKDHYSKFSYYKDGAVVFSDPGDFRIDFVVKEIRGSAFLRTEIVILPNQKVGEEVSLQIVGMTKEIADMVYFEATGKHLPED